MNVNDDVLRLIITYSIDDFMKSFDSIGRIRLICKQWRQQVDVLFETLNLNNQKLKHLRQFIEENAECIPSSLMPFQRVNLICRLVIKEVLKYPGASIPSQLFLNQIPRQLECFAQWMDQESNAICSTLLKVDQMMVKNQLIFSCTLNQLNLPIVPKEICQPQLVKLILIGNLLAHLPSCFDKLKTLEVLNLDRNQFKQWPTEIFSLTSLRVLTLSFNQLEEAPPELGRLTNLTELRLGNNRIRTLAKEISQLKKLKKLDLFNNQLPTIPGNVGVLLLDSFNILRNPIDHLSAEILESSNRSICKSPGVQSFKKRQTYIQRAALLISKFLFHPTKHH